MLRMSFGVIAIAASLTAAAQAGPTVKGAARYHLTPGAAPSAELTAAIRKADADLFAAVFDRCDTDAVAAMLTPDFRFIHDKNGESARAKFLDDLKGHCARLKSGEDFAARRELVAPSLEVWPISSYGALEIGVHRFYARLPNKPETLTETGNFMILWKKVDANWQMAESISYGHELAN
ncbi:MAG: nuclear transport factor 2 family protein [Alphaproteobacteria bacterium]|nr:nuclear transport factor 2 family protein [Alphaproteobacteria bacterium]MBV9694552.1 nuclear transport factor 2 family protein [Alphaproteobacteria bacterium]